MLLFIMITVVIFGKNEADEQTLCYRLLSSALIKNFQWSMLAMLCYVMIMVAILVTGKN